MSKPSGKHRDIATYYDEYSKWYDRERTGRYYSFINDLEAEKVLPLAINMKTLEIGCGTGLILERVHAVASEAHGVDISRGMLDACRKKGLRVHFGSATDLLFEDNTFDLVYSFKVLPHVPEIHRALSEITRVTKPGGRLVLEFYNSYSFKGFNHRLRSMAPGSTSIYVRHDTLDDIQAFLPESVQIVGTRGIRIFGPSAYCYILPGLAELFRFLDRKACDGPLRRFGGYFVVEAVLHDNRD